VLLSVGTPQSGQAPDGGRLLPCTSPGSGSCLTSRACKSGSAPGAA